MADEVTEVTFGTYYVRSDAAGKLERAVAESWAALRRLGFIAWDSPELFRSVAEPLRYVELTKWVPGMMRAAHAHPDLVPIWTRLAVRVEPHPPAVVERGFVLDEFVPVWWAATL